MNRRDVLKSGAALTASTAVLSARAFAERPAHFWDRPLHIAYAGGEGKRLNHDDDALLKAFDQVPRGITAMTPFLLNVKDPSPFAQMIKQVQSRGTVIVPGVGARPTAHPLNDPLFKDMAKAYREYTDHIRLENLQGFLRLDGGQAQIQEMIDYLTGTLKFKHIMMNPWPRGVDGKSVPFKNPELDSSFNNVRLNFDRKPPYTITPDPRNWLVNMTEVDRILEYRPSLPIIVNYESAPQHEALLQLEKDKPGSSIAAMEIGAAQCQNDKNNLYWAPPFTHIYDPIALNTWSWIAKRLNQMP